MVMPRIVMCPVDHRRTPRIVYHFTAYLDRIAGAYRTTWRYSDVVNDLDPSGAASNVEGFVHRMRARAVEEARSRGNRPAEIDPCRCRSGIGSRQIHRSTHHARWYKRLVNEPVR